jgi:hypothetical protein
VYESTQFLAIIFQIASEKQLGRHLKGQAVKLLEPRESTAALPAKEIVFEIDARNRYFDILPTLRLYRRKGA